MKVFQILFFSMLMMAPASASNENVTQEESTTYSTTEALSISNKNTFSYLLMLLTMAQVTTPYTEKYGVNPKLTCTDCNKTISHLEFFSEVQNTLLCSLFTDSDKIEIFKSFINAFAELLIAENQPAIAIFMIESFKNKDLISNGCPNCNGVALTYNPNSDSNQPIILKPKLSDKISKYLPAIIATVQATIPYEKKFHGRPKLGCINCDRQISYMGFLGAAQLTALSKIEIGIDNFEMINSFFDSFTKLLMAEDLAAIVAFMLESLKNKDLVDYSCSDCKETNPWVYDANNFCQAETIEDADEDDDDSATDTEADEPVTPLPEATT